MLSMTTTIAPNLGKVFDSLTARPVTPEDIEFITPGDWVKRQEHPWCYQFKKWDGDRVICTWEGDEFFIPRHLLMVCTVIEGERTKFYEFTFKVGDRFAINPGVTQEFVVKAIAKGKNPYCIKWDCGEEQRVDIEFFRKFQRVENDQSPREQFWRCKYGLHPTIAPTQDGDDRFILCDILSIEEQINLCQQRIIQQNWRIQDLEAQSKQAQDIKKAIQSAKSAIASEEVRIDQLLEELIVYRQLLEMGVDKAEARTTVLKLINS